MGIEVGAVRPADPDRQRLGDRQNGPERGVNGIEGRLDRRHPAAAGSRPADLAAGWTARLTHFL